MPDISNFALQYSSVNFAALLASPYDLFITEGDAVPKPGTHGAINGHQLAALQAQGRTVAGYVDVAVTDDNRAYWNPAWTSDGTDTGALTADAPSWLQGQPKNAFGYIAKFWDPSWQAIVIHEARWLVEHGYNGVFLDDVGTYFDLIGQPGEPDAQTLASDMIDFVAKIDATIKRINPDAYVVANGDPYIGGDSGSGAEAAKFSGAIDKMLLENPNDQTLSDAITDIGAGNLIALYSVGSEADKQADVLHAYSLGVTAYDAPSASYNALGAFINPGTTGDDGLAGGDGPNTLSGLDGNDTIAGLGGDDHLSGDDGDDILSGGDGNDVLHGGRGADLLMGGAGKDVFFYSGAAESINLHFDTIGDFDAVSDRIALPFAVTAIDPKIVHGSLSDATFEHDLRNALPASALGANHAVFFVPDGGGHAGEIFLIVDANGVAGYQSSEDLIIRLQGAHHLAQFSTGDFT